MPLYRADRVDLQKCGYLVRHLLFSAYVIGRYQTCSLSIQLEKLLTKLKTDLLEGGRTKSKAVGSGKGLK